MQPIPDTRVPAFNRKLGMDRMRAGGGRAEVELRLDAELTNKRGVAHGGAIAALLDSALGAAVVSGIRPEEWCGTVQLSVQFLAPGRGSLLIGRARMVRRGNRIAFSRGDVVDERGDVIATAQGTWHIWPTRPK